jgi:hypothetical protein
MRGDLAAIALLGALAWFLPSAALRFARPAVLNFGPNDADYVRGFRQDWERDGRTRFHWTTQGSNVSLPLHVIGPGHVLRMRVRRHFIEPSLVRLFVEGRAVHAFEIRADPRIAYRIEEVRLPPLEGRHPFVLSIEAPSEQPRALGIAMDWLELERGAGGSFALTRRYRVTILALALMAFLVPRLVGASIAAAASSSALLLAGAAIGSALDVIASERIAREGWGPLLALGLFASMLARSPRARAFIGIDDRRTAAWLTTLALLALAVRLVMLLHPQYFYPDVRVHGTFALQLARRGLFEFLHDFTANQFRFSLGLQQVGEHWYAFPYPPVFYMLSAPLVALFQYRAEPAVSIAAAWINSVEVFVVFALARQLGISSAGALAGSALVPLLPLFTARLALAYFPALVGHAVDALAILILLKSIDGLAAPRRLVGLSAMLAVALLTYTQGLLNFAVLLGLFLAIDAAAERTRAARRRQLAVLIAGVLGGALALAIFYGRYVPVFLDMAKGVPMPEEQILIEKQQRTRVPEEELVPEEKDPYAGPSFDPLRGLRKAGWRLFVFYSAFAPLVVLAVLRFARGLSGPPARFVWAWALTYLVLNLLSGGLPGPNLVRYNKDLEIVAPLVCIALGSAAVDGWRSRHVAVRALAVAFAVSFVAFGSVRAYEAVTSTFVMER